MKYAIVFSAENKVVLDQLDSNASSPYEKMAIGLAYSIRQHHTDVDVYCGNFTNNKLSKYAQQWFSKLDVNYVEDIVFNNIGSDDSFCFLRTFCKDYFAKTLLDTYDYLIYLDLDVIQLNPIKFDFDPTQPMVLKETMPQWTVNYHKEFLTGLDGPLCYNWVEIINKHNCHLFSMDWNNPEMLIKHNSDVILSNRILKTNLPVIEQDIGGYHFFKPVKQDSIFYHYDSLGPAGSLPNIKLLFPSAYQKYVFFFERLLNIKVNNQENYWEDLAKDNT